MKGYCGRRERPWRGHEQSALPTLAGLHRTMPRARHPCIAPAFAQEVAVLHVQHPQGFGRHLTHTEGEGLLSVESAASCGLVASQSLNWVASLVTLPLLLGRRGHSFLRPGACSCADQFSSASLLALISIQQGIGTCQRCRCLAVPAPGLQSAAAPCLAGRQRCCTQSRPAGGCAHWAPKSCNGVVWSAGCWQHRPSEAESCTAHLT